MPWHAIALEFICDTHILVSHWRAQRVRRALCALGPTRGRADTTRLSRGRIALSPGRRHRRQSPLVRPLGTRKYTAVPAGGRSTSENARLLRGGRAPPLTSPPTPRVRIAIHGHYGRCSASHPQLPLWRPLWRPLHPPPRRRKAWRCSLEVQPGGGLAEASAVTSTWRWPFGTCRRGWTGSSCSLVG